MKIVVFHVAIVRFTSEGMNGYRTWILHPIRNETTDNHASTKKIYYLLLCVEEGMLAGLDRTYVSRRS